MNLKTKLENDLKVALKSKDAATTSALRLVLAAVKNDELKGKGEIEDAAVMQVLTKLAKQRRESIDAFEKGGRQDLVDKEKKELGIIEGYLPQPLSESELDQIIDEAISESKAAAPQDMGKVMKIVMPKTQGRADGKQVSDIVRRKLST
jgi:uncharacterized protein YqeY